MAASRFAGGKAFLGRMGHLGKIAGPAVGGTLVALPILSESFGEYGAEGEPAVDNIAAGTTAAGVGALGAGAGALAGGAIGSIFGPAGTAIGASLGAGLAGGPAAGAGADIGRGANDLLRSMGVLPKEKSETDKEIERAEKIARAQLGLREEAVPVSRAELEMMADIGARKLREARLNQQILGGQAAMLNAAASPGQTWDPSNFATALGGIGGLG